MIHSKLKGFFTEHWKYLAVSTACRLNLFDAIQDTGDSKDLCTKLKLDGQNLQVLLMALCDFDFLEEVDDKYQLTEMSVFLTEKHPKSLKYSCMNWSREHLTAFDHLDYTIQTGKSSFQHLHNCSFFDFLHRNPEKLHQYHRAMAEYARDDYQKLPLKIDFSKHDKIMDVGGGLGNLLHILKNVNPDLKYYLFDLPEVIALSKFEEIEKIGGSFFEQIPPISDAIILSRILHDWQDSKALQIAKNCYEALPQNGILYLIENCSDKIDSDLSLLSLNMMVICESYERSSFEYIAILESAGFRFVEDQELNLLQTILKFEKI